MFTHTCVVLSVFVTEIKAAVYLLMPLCIQDLRLKTYLKPKRKCIWKFAIWLRLTNLHSVLNDVH